MHSNISVCGARLLPMKLSLYYLVGFILFCYLISHPHFYLSIVFYWVMSTPNIIWLDLCLAGISAYSVKQVLNKNPASYPPSSHGWPLIGNIQDIPQIKPWLTFVEWGKKYGECLISPNMPHFNSMHVIQATSHMSRFWVSTSLW
jgi:hypothetical protein